MSETLTRAQAIKFLGLDEKTFDNYFQNADEFNCLERVGNRGRYLFDRGGLEEWLKGYKERCFELDINDYALCLDFALAQHFRGYVLSDWGTGRQREFGQKITNWVKGQLAEVAVRKFLAREFNLHVELDFRIYDKIVPQDIIGVIENGKIRPPKIGVGIKSSKPKSAFLVLGENEVVLEARRSDVYVFCRPDIPDDHLLRITRDQIIAVIKNEPHYPSYKDLMPSFENMKCEVAGYCWLSELERATSIPGQEFSGYRYIKKSGGLHRTKEKWQEFISRL